jgi:superfamily II DNA or RNA helicase
MSDVLTISKYNDVYIHVDCERSIAQELRDAFSFEVPGAKFHPKVRARVWDGKIRLFNTRNNLIYFGLLEQVLRFAELRGYESVVEDNINVNKNYSLSDAEEFGKTLNAPFDIRTYQTEAFAAGVRENRALIISPTGSGKSFIIHMLLQYYKKKTLLVVPTTGLVEQMKGDLISYGTNPDFIHCIKDKDKRTNKPITITTWQAIFRMPKEFFEDFDVVIGDEAHQYKATSLVGIMEKLVNCKYRFGFTGSLDGSVTHEWVLQGLFGSIKQFTKTKDLIKEKHLSAFRIRCLLLNHRKEDCIKRDYPQEMDFLVSNNKRNKFITKLVLSLKGNTLVLFQYVDKHGRVLYDQIKEKDPERDVEFIYGGVSGKDRNEIRINTESADNSIIVASYGTFSTGINIRNLHNIVFASPSKSRIRNLQSIGRVLRLSDNEAEAVLYDISDNLMCGKKKNYTLDHFGERLKLYISEEFDYKIYNIEL